MTMGKKYKVLALVLGLLALGTLFYLLFIRFYQIKNDEVGVKVNIGDSTVEAIRGDVVYMPLRTYLYIYPTTIQTIAMDTIRVIVKDGVEFAIAPSVSYQLSATKADIFYTKCGKSMDLMNKTFLREQVRKAFSDAANAFTADSLVYHKNRFEKSAYEQLSEQLGNVGLVLISSDSNLEIPKRIKDIVDLRAQALQDAIVAESRFREANALRREDSLRNSALTSLAIQRMFIDKWNGKFPNNGDVPQIYKDITGN